MIPFSEHDPRQVETYMLMALALAVAAMIVPALSLDLAWAATLVPGGTEKLGDGVKDAAKTAETGLIGYFGPIASVLAGLVTGLATRATGGSNAGSAASGVAAAAIVAFIPVAGITTYTTSGSAAADFGLGMTGSSVTPFNRDIFSVILIVTFFAAIWFIRRYGVRDGRQLANRG